MKNATTLSDDAKKANDQNTNLKIEVKDAVSSSDVATLNALAGKTGGAITASISGAASINTSLGNLTSSDKITFSISGDATVAQMAGLSGKTDKTDISLAGNITGTSVFDFIKDAGAYNVKTDNYTAAKGHTTDENIVLNDAGQTTLAMTLAKNITALNSIMSDAEGSVTAEITDPNGHLVAGVASLTTSDNDNITVNLGTLDPSGTNLDEIKKLEAKLLQIDNSGMVDEHKALVEQDVATKLRDVEDLVLPLLYNLQKNPEKEYIHWPNRTAIIDKQIEKIKAVTRYYERI